MTHTYNTLRFSHTHTQRFGGYITYFKLVWYFYSEILKHFSSCLSFWDKVYFILTVPFNTIWWLTIKPLGCVFKVKTKYNGDIKYNCGVTEYYEYSARKTKTFKIIGIPFFWYFSNKLNTKDLKRILGEDFKDIKSYNKKR